MKATRIDANRYRLERAHGELFTPFREWCGEGREVVSIAYLGRQSMSCVVVFGDLPPGERWIPVEEQLPEEYLIVNLRITGDFSGHKVTAGQRIKDGWWDARHPNTPGQAVTVLAWRPLPNP